MYEIVQNDKMGKIRDIVGLLMWTCFHQTLVSKRFNKGDNFIRALGIKKKN